MSESKRRKRELGLDEEEQYVEVSSLQDISIDRIDIVGPGPGGGGNGAIGRTFHLLKSRNNTEVDNMQQEIIRKDICELAKSLGKIPDELRQAVGYISKLESEYGEVHSTSWSAAKLILEQMLILAKRLQQDDAPKPLLISLLTGYIERGKAGFWQPTKPPRGVPQFSKSKAKTQKSSDNKEELNAVETIEDLARSTVNKSDTNDKRTFHEICGDLWESHPNLLRLALMQHHQKVQKSHEDRKLAKGNGTGLTGLEKCDVLAREMVLHDSKLTIEQAQERVFRLYPQIYQQAQEECEAGLPLAMGT